MASTASDVERVVATLLGSPEMDELVGSSKKSFACFGVAVS